MTSTQVRIRIAAETYALSVEHVQQVAELGALTPVPGARDSVLGLYNLRGSILPVYDLAAILGIERSGLARRLLVAESHGRRIGLAVDEVTDVTDLEVADGESSSPLLLGAGMVGDELVGFIDVVALFSHLLAKEAV